MKYAVIDIGSNSVRLMLNVDGVTLYKRIITTRLGERLADTGSLLPEAMERTARAAGDLAAAARGEGVQPFVFATEAVRAAANGKAFCALVEEKCGIVPDVLAGRDEAVIGFLGCTEGRTGICGMMDIGGGSTEISVGEGGVPAYTKSFPVGVVRIFDRCGEDRTRAEEYAAGILNGCAGVPKSEEFFGIGGTCTNLAAAANRVIPYDAAKVHGSVVTLEALVALEDKLYEADRAGRVAMGIDPARADVIAGGATLCRLVMETLGLTRMTASETDNMEGYLTLLQKRGVIAHEG